MKGRHFRNGAMLPLHAICAPWMPSGFAVVLACRGGTDCFDLRDWLAMKLAEGSRFV